MEYRHTQTGYTAVLVTILLFVALLIVVLAVDDEPAVVIGVGALVVFLTAVIAVFNRLTTTVGAGLVQVAFGWGWPRRRIEVREITGFSRVRNKWYYGWGIRLVPGGWMYNVWGLDAVELVLASGRRFRIGSDEPDDLMAALSLHTSLRPS